MEELDKKRIFAYLASTIMGSACCSLRSEDFEDYINRSCFVHCNCICLNCFLQNFLHVSQMLTTPDSGFGYISMVTGLNIKLKCTGKNVMYASLFEREVSSLPSSIQGAAVLTATASSDTSLSEIYRSPPRPLPYDVDPRFFRVQRDGLVSRREKGSSHSHEESEPLRRSKNDADSESLAMGDKWSACDDGSKELLKSSMKLSARKSGNDSGHVYSSSEDEDVCPTCLEEYIEENPKILTKCSHHFHLGCIYEWMERSENCPVCGKSAAAEISYIVIWISR
ncbi:hypothetical protein V2J09_013359 [Rumex salicifolius]